MSVEITPAPRAARACARRPNSRAPRRVREGGAHPVERPSRLQACIFRGLHAALLVGCSVTAGIAVAAEDLSEALRVARPALADSPFGRPLLLESSDRDGEVRGTVLALVDHPVAALRSSLDTAAEWCEVLILHLNVKRCEPSTGAGAGSLLLRIGRKGAADGFGAHVIEFAFRAPDSSAERFGVAMEAASGPLGTSRYRLNLDAIPAGPGVSFLRLGYAYDYGTTARVAMSSYLGTLGRDKVGFSTTGAPEAGEPVYVRGLRGALERNTMRYFLGIETYLASAARPPDQRAEWRYGAWFDATERHRRQLHEMSKAEYLAGKQGQSSSRAAGSARELARLRPE